MKLFKSVMIAVSMVIAVILLIIFEILTHIVIFGIGAGVIITIFTMVCFGALELLKAEKKVKQ